MRAYVRQIAVHHAVGLFVWLAVAASLVGGFCAGAGAFPHTAFAQTAQGSQNTAKTDNSLDEQLLPDSSFIYDASIADLSGADSYYDNQTVLVTGEAVGDNIRADILGDYRWITLQSTDSTYAEISVFMTAQQASRITSLGNYSTRGDIVSVQGTFHLVCNEHEGLTDLHADSVSIIDAGYPIEHKFNVRDFVPGIVLVAIGALLLFIFARLRERLR